MEISLTELKKKYKEKRELYFKFKSRHHYLSPGESEKLIQELDLLWEQIINKQKSREESA